MDAKPKVLIVGRGAVPENLVSGMMKSNPYDKDISLHKIPKDGNYDLVMVWNRLEYEPIKRADRYMESIASVLKPGGLAHIYCIAAEWVAECIATHQPSKIWRGMLFGRQQDAQSHAKNVFTMRDLRAVVEQAGLHGIDANTGHFIMKDEKTGDEIRVAFHYVVGWKPLPKDDESDIINTEIN